MARPLAVFDIDGTLFRWQLYYEVVLRFLDEGLITEPDATKVRAAYTQWQSRVGTFHDFEMIAISALDNHLVSIDMKAFERTVSAVLADSSHRVYSYSRNLAKQLKDEGYFLLAISGSMQEIAEPFAKQYGFDECLGWLYERSSGAFTGKTIRRTVGNKAQLLNEYVNANGFTLEKSLAIGDSGGDIDMLGLVERPIAFNPSEELLDEAAKQGWEIVVERKNIAYSLQKGTDGTYLLAEAATV